MNNRRTKRFLLLQGGLTTEIQISTDNAPRAYLGTSTELGALISRLAEPRAVTELGALLSPLAEAGAEPDQSDYLMAEPRVDPSMDASRVELCTCGKPWDNCPLKGLRGKQHPTNIAFRCRLMRNARQRIETQRRPWWRRLTRALNF
jgi:hypothetical protein